MGLPARFRIFSGVGVHDLPRFLRWSGLRCDEKKPLYLFLTHAHFDHSGGTHLFAENPATTVLAHVSEAKWVKAASPLRTAAWIEEGEVLPKPANWSAKHFFRAPSSPSVGHGAEWRHVAEGDVIDLGRRQFKVISTSIKR